MYKFLSMAVCLLAAGTVQAALVDRYTFDNPMPGDLTKELDLGADATPITLMNGAQRVADSPVAGGGSSLRTKSVAGGVNDDWKAGVLFSNGTSTLNSTGNVTGITIMGWFKLNTAPTGTTSMIGVLRGDAGNTPTAHDGRALMEISVEGGQTKIIALGRRRDTEGSTRPVAISTATVGTLLPVGEWVHMAATFDYDHGAIKLYRNGLEIAASVPSFTSWALTAGEDRTSNSASDGIKIGGQLDDDTTPMDGWIDEVRVYNELLPATGANSVFSVYQSQVPEPGTLAMLAAGVLALLQRRR